VKSRLKQWHEGELLIGLVRIVVLVLSLALFLLFSKTQPLVLQDFLIVSVVIIYSTFRIIFPTYWYRNRFVTYALVLIDVGFCCFLPFVTGGFRSAFILYPLTAVLSIAFYFRQSLAFFVATVASSSVIASEIASWHSQHSDNLSAQIYVALLGMYTITAYLIAWLPFIANLNLSANIKKKTIIEERSRISRELHDSLAQRLGSLILKLDMLKSSIAETKTADALNQLSIIKHDAQDTYIEVREIIDQLRIKMPDSTRILPTLAEYTQEFSQNTGIDCKFYMADGHAELEPLATVEILRIVQEALNNVKKHSGANQIEVKYESTTEDVKVVIKDNGKGFAPGSVKGQHGLVVMRERAEGIGGKLEVVTAPGKGTSIEVTIPINSQSVRRANG
jgi:signal transduction histidine kinase